MTVEDIYIGGEVLKPEELNLSNQLHRYLLYDVVLIMMLVYLMVRRLVTQQNPHCLKCIVRYQELILEMES